MFKELTELEFENTFSNTMTDVTESAEPIVDIWNYVEELVRQNIVKHLVYENHWVESVYRNDISTVDHILLPTKFENTFIVS